MPRLLLGRQHGTTQPVDRTALEAAGWRTTLEYRENHVRGRDGRLTHVEVVWHAEAERAGPDDVGPAIISATASTVDKVWSRLRTQAELADVRTPRRLSRAPAAGAAAPSASQSAPRGRRVPTSVATA